LRQWHTHQGFADPTEQPSINKIITGIMRVHGTPKVKAPPVLTEHLLSIVSILKAESSLRSIRDSALLQVGFFGAFRRSELVSICREHIDYKDMGVDILVPKSKTDQEHKGQHCAISYGNKQLCPVSALSDWLSESEITHGPVFRAINHLEEINDKALSDLSVTKILKSRAKKAGIDCAESFTSHSLRRGLATCASRNGSDISSIMKQGRWRDVNTVMEYIDENKRFEDNVAHRIISSLDDSNNL
jgi:integrase